MADLIDRAALRIDVWERLSDAVCDLVEAPAVDAVEVVRCIKCELHDNCYAEDVFKTARMDLEKAFCCLGSERRTDGRHR